MARFGRQSIGVALAAVLAGCSSLSVPPEPKARTLDYLADDVAEVVLALDLPLSLEPLPEGSKLGFDITTRTAGIRRVEARLVRADAGDLAGTLPVPPDGRTYFLFGFAEADRAAVRSAQAWAKALPEGELTGLLVTFAPQLCAAAPVDPKAVRVAVLPALESVPRLAPLIAMQPLANLLDPGELAAIAPCAGHSG